MDKISNKKRPLYAILLIGAMTMLSRICGLIRDMVIAHYFGSSTYTDVFFVVFKIPNFLRRIFAEGAFSQAFIPVLSEYKTKEPDKVKHLIDTVSGTLIGILLIVTILGMLGAPWVICIFAPGFARDPHKLMIAGEMLRIVFPYLFFIALTGLASSIMNTYHRFGVGAFTPVLLNLSLIFFTVCFIDAFSPAVFTLAWGVFIAGIVQLCFQAPFLWRLNLLPKPRWGWHHPGVQKILRLIIPALFGVSVAQISLLIDTMLASFLKTGSVSWLYYSERIVELPLGVFGIAISSVILPSLSNHHANKNPQDFSKTMDWAIRLVLLISIPATVALYQLSEICLYTIFYHGAMTSQDITMAAKSLCAFSIGLTGFMLVKTLSTGYFSRQDSKTPVRYAIIALTMNIIINLILIGPLQHVGLALATSMTSILNAVLLLQGLIKRKIFIPEKGWRTFAFQLCTSTCAMALFLYFFLKGRHSLENVPLMHQIQLLTTAVLCGGLIYIIVLLLCGLRWKDLHR